MSLFNIPQIVIKKTLATFEQFTGFFSVIQSDHSYIHAGYGFQYPCKFTLKSSATSDGVKGCIIKPPTELDGTFLHWRPTRVSTIDAAIEVALYRNPTYTGGTELTGIVNLNENSTNTPKTKLIDGAITITDNGTLLSIDGLGAGGNPSKVAGGNSGFENEIVKNPAREYLLLFSNLTTTETRVYADLFWYEEAMG